jgi:hypothetical protein
MIITHTMSSTSKSPASLPRTQREVREGVSYTCGEMSVIRIQCRRYNRSQCPCARAYTRLPFVAVASPQTTLSSAALAYTDIDPQWSALFPPDEGKAYRQLVPHLLRTRSLRADLVDLAFEIRCECLRYRCCVRGGYGSPGKAYVVEFFFGRGRYCLRGGLCSARCVGDAG